MAYINRRKIEHFHQMTEKLQKEFFDYVKKTDFPPDLDSRNIERVLYDFETVLSGLERLLNHL